MTRVEKRNFMGILKIAAAAPVALALCYAELQAVKRLRAAAKSQFPSLKHARRSTAPRRCRRARAPNCRPSCVLPVSPGQPSARRQALPDPREWLGCSGNIQGRDNDKAAARRRYKTYRLHAARRDASTNQNPRATQTRLHEASRVEWWRAACVESDQP